MPERDAISAIGPIFERAGIRWVVIGAVAANRYRRDVRLTGDLDLLLSNHGSGPSELEIALRKSGWSIHRGAPDESLWRLRHPTFGMVDLILAETEYQHEAIERATAEQRDDGTTVRVLRVEDVLVHKLIASRPRDLADIEDILACRPSFDQAYVSRWADYWDVLTLWQRLQTEAGR